MQTDLITKVYFNEHLTHSCVGIPQGLQALLSSLVYFGRAYILIISCLYFRNGALTISLPIPNIFSEMFLDT